MPPMAESLAAKSPEKPRRNLTQAFEALCVVSPDESVKEEKSDVYDAKHVSAVVSPTGVADLQDVPVTLPDLQLHPDLARDLTPSCIERVSCYSILHDMNKEASAMSMHDPLLERKCPLVLAAHGQSTNIGTNDGTTEQVMMDEEKWLLQAMQQYLPSSTPCPETFLQAMGEREYENPVQSVAGHTRTQLWKPSRSWWEAKSGKNPWIEPSSHNKRWRYLWPLIHYHKFLAKCIKKLKRNGVDVKLSHSPVSLFLREEVCAVSDHLAAVSLFDSEKWMQCLEHFKGWTVLTQEAVAQYREFVARLSMRPVNDHADVDSPLLRSQIDESFLRTMASHREQLREAATAVLSSMAQTSTSEEKASHPIYPSPQVPRQINGVRRPRYYPPGWYDTNSVHSELSANSYPHPQPQSTYDYSMYVHGYYSDNSQSTTGGYTYPSHYPWMEMGYFPPYYGPPASPYHEPAEVPATPKYDPENHMNMSPYWSHLDQATLAMGLATPKVTPSTPSRRPENPSVPADYVAPLLRYTRYHEPASPATQFLMSPTRRNRKKTSPKKL